MLNRDVKKLDIAERKAANVRFTAVDAHAIKTPARQFHVSMWEMSDFDDQPLGFLVRGLMARLRPHAVQALRPLGLGLPEFVCMRILDEDPGRTSAELARYTHVTAQAMNQVLQGLEEMGLVTRPATAPSGRALPAQLSRKGKALLRRAEGAVASSDEQLLAHLSLAERRQLKRLLYRAGNPSIEERSITLPARCTRRP
jgi:DNA-binding MarR family transcriptional regulator